MFGCVSKYETGEESPELIFFSVILWMTYDARPEWPLITYDSFFQVECCTITLDNKSFKLIVQYKCRAETIKTHHISILEQETLQAAYVTDNVPNM